MNKKTKPIEDEGPLTKADVIEIVTEVVNRIVNGAIAASEVRMIRRMDRGFERIDERFELIDRRFERIDEKFEHADQSMKSGLNLVCEKIEEGNEYMDRHVGNTAKILSKIDHRVDKLEQCMEKLRHRPA